MTILPTGYQKIAIQTSQKLVTQQFSFIQEFRVSSKWWKRRDGKTFFSIDALIFLGQTHEFLSQQARLVWHHGEWLVRQDNEILPNRD